VSQFCGRPIRFLTTRFEAISALPGAMSGFCKLHAQNKLLLV